MNSGLKVPYGCLKNESITYLLPSTINKIGRNPLTNTIILNHNSISKEHALIEFDSNRQRIHFRFIFIEWYFRKRY